MPSGVLAARATLDGVDTPFPVVLDTGSPVTAIDDVALGVAPPDAATLRARVGDLRVWSDVDPPVPRLALHDVQYFLAPLSPVGLGGDLFAPNGVIGGDNLNRFAVAIDPRAPTPLVRLLPSVTTCSCDLADACHAVFGVTVGGGAQSIAIGNTLYPYPATRVVIEACLEPVADPVSRNEPCVVAQGADGRVQPPVQRGYTASGVDVRFVVATGFPGIALSANVFDRLRGAGAASAALAGSPVEVHWPGRNVDNAGRATLGDAASAIAALALVSREVYFGPCAELARSRRLRRVPPGVSKEKPIVDELTCLSDFEDPAFRACCPSGGGCDAICYDDNPAVRAAAIVELSGPLEVIVLPETTPVLRAVNEDLRPIFATQNPPPVVEGVLGMAALRQLVATLDYPGRRLIARCADGAPGCLAYPRFSRESECDRDCTPIAATYVTSSGMRPVETQQLPPTSGLPGGLCPAAPSRQ
jgi:hypothetical protein